MPETATPESKCICSKFARENGLITRTCPEHDPLSDAQKDALRRHGYNPDHVPRGSAGPPGGEFKNSDGFWLRNKVCELDGILIDGHEPSDLDPMGGCMWCDKSTEDIVAQLNAEEGR